MDDLGIPIFAASKDMPRLLGKLRSPGSPGSPGAGRRDSKVRLSSVLGFGFVGVSNHQR